MTEADVQRTRAAQAELYGEPLHDLLGRCGSALGLTQGRLAALLGVSAPMLSQLINGHRVKLGNPAAGQRLHLMREALIDLEAGRIDQAEAIAQVERNRDADVLTMTTQHDAGGVVRGIQELFRATASAADFLVAAERIEPQQPEVAELLRIYGASRTDQALEHYRRVRSAPAAS